VQAVVPFAAGGPTDKVARELTMIMSKHLGTTIVIENLGGAGGTIGAKKVAQSKGDGYTILIHHIGMSTAPALYRNLGFDPLKDFEMVGEIADVPMVMVGNKQLPPATSRNWCRTSRPTPASCRWPTPASARPRTCAACCSRARSRPN
jgi:tripartite-type tricarboxylate transporter receptor subunit TctC